MDENTEAIPSDPSPAVVFVSLPQAQPAHTVIV